MNTTIKKKIEMPVYPPGVGSDIFHKDVLEREIRRK